MRGRAALALALVGCADPRPAPRAVAPAPAPVPDVVAPPPPAPSGCASAAWSAPMPLVAAPRCHAPDATLARALAAVRRSAAPGPMASRSSQVPALRGVARRLDLSAGEQAQLARAGLLVIPRWSFPGYAAAFDEVRRSQLPVFVSVDAVLYAVHAGSAEMFAAAAERRVAPLLARVLDALACALPSAPLPDADRRALDVSVAVGRALLRGEAPQSALGDPDVVARAVALIAAAPGATDPPLLRAVAWLSAGDAPLVTAVASSPPPRARALAALVAATPGATDDLALLARAWPLVTRAAVAPDADGWGAARRAFALGHDRVGELLASAPPEVVAGLAAARASAQVHGRPVDDVAAARRAAVAGLSAPAPGVRPSFMSRPAYADLRIHAALAAAAELDAEVGGPAGEASAVSATCAIGAGASAGYVEPAPATYAALRTAATRGAELMRALDPTDELGGGAYFDRVGEVLAALDQIGADELAGRALTADERAVLGMIAELAPAPAGASADPPTAGGWWFELAEPGTRRARAWAGAPQLAVFAIDTNGPARYAVGPVAGDGAAHGPQAPWVAGYQTAEASAREPTLELIYPAQETAHRLDAAITTEVELGPVTLELYDAHRAPLAQVTRVIHPGTTYVSFHRGGAPLGAGVHLTAGAYHGWFDVTAVEGAAYAVLGPRAVP